MFVFKRLAELDLICERINQTLLKVCPELGINYEISDCVRIRLHNMNTRKIIEGFKFSPEDEINDNELAVLAALKMFFYYLSNNMRVKSGKTVRQMFRSVNHSLNYRWK